MNLSKTLSFLLSQNNPAATTVKLLRNKKEKEEKDVTMEINGSGPVIPNNVTNFKTSSDRLLKWLHGTEALRGPSGEEAMGTSLRCERNKHRRGNTRTFH